MSFWFSPTRTEKDEDLHPTDIEFIQKELRTDTSYVTFGNKGIASMFCDIIPGFNNLVNKWANPEIVKSWGEFLMRLCYHLHEHSFDCKEREERDIYFYGNLFKKLGERGIGLILSW